LHISKLAVTDPLNGHPSAPPTSEMQTEHQVSPGKNSAAKQIGERWRIVIGSDDAGLAFKVALKADLEADSRVAQVIDVGSHTPYLQMAVEAVRELTEGRADRALLICNSGLGIALSANRVPGIRAVTASNSSAVQRSVLDHDAQVLCFGHQVISIERARRLLREWLGYRFNCRSATNVTVINRYEDAHRYEDADQLTASSSLAAALPRGT
jgi:ribose 5-phosphate isomerase B